MKKLFIIFSLLAPATAQAQDKTDESREVIYKQRTEIDFDSVDVNGELIKPAGALVIDRKRAQFNPLIKLRQDFNPEIKRTIRQVQ
jgi:hypothetical protein